MHNTRIRISYDTVSDWDLEQIAEDHSDVMVSDFDKGLFESYISDIEENTIVSGIYGKRKKDDQQ